MIKIKTLHKVNIIIEVLFFIIALVPIAIGKFDLIHALLIVCFVFHSYISSMFIALSLRRMLNQEQRINKSNTELLQALRDTLAEANNTIQSFIQTEQEIIDNDSSNINRTTEE